MERLDGSKDSESRERGKSDWRKTGNPRTCFRKVDIRLPGKGNSNFHGARPVY